MNSYANIPPAYSACFGSSLEVKALAMAKIVWLLASQGCRCDKAGLGWEMKRAWVGCAVDCVLQAMMVPPIILSLESCISGAGCVE